MQSKYIKILRFDSPDHENDFQDKNYWLTLQLYLNKSRENKFYDNITDNDYFNNNLDLLLVLKLTNSIFFTKALATLAIQKYQFIYKIDQQTPQSIKQCRQLGEKEKLLKIGKKFIKGKWERKKNYKF